MRRGPSPTRMLWSEMNDGKANERNAYESIISGTSFVLPLNSFGPQYQHGCDCFRRPASLPTYEDLPGAARLNELGDEGWLLAGVVDQKSNGSVHFYFVRQKME